MPPDARAATREAFLRDWGRALHTYGVPAHRLESALDELAEKLEVEAQFLSTPTSLMCAFGPPGDQRVSLSRLTPGSTNLARLVALDALGQGVHSGAIDVESASRQIQEILSEKAQFGRLAFTVAYALSSSAAAFFLGGRGVDIRWAGLVGLAVGALVALARDPPASRIVAPVGALLAAVGAGLAAHQGASATVVTLAGVLGLLPGLALTVAMTELGTGNLVSGTSRLAGAITTLLQLAFGTFTGRLVVTLLPPPTRPPRVPLPEWADAAGLVTMVVATVVLLNARWRHAGWLALGVVVAWGSTRLSAGRVDPDLIPFFGAMAVTAAANLAARLGRKPATLVSVPGLLLLVPGSIGLRGMTAMLDDAVKGMELLFQAGFVAVSLAAGVLVAHVIITPRRSL